ncbi:cysteine proteinase [Sistotremastrum niveocremeum HHB9708]|nr:cysteine proteinase [Sistotremastrum niveocremeum HHB9708]
MRRGHQEDAEEFLGFYLDTLEEELLGLSSSLNSDSGSAESKPNAVEEEQEDAPAEEGWSEVGKRNRVIVTRTVKSMDTAISRIFGGTSRSTIRRPGTHDSVIVEDWRHLGLDIQPENVKTIEDALRNLSRPETVQVTSPQSGTLIDASKQYLVDSLPPILVLHLKRFHYDSVAKDVVKIRKNVRLSPELEFPDESIVSAHRGRSTTRYKLYGVLYHHGLSATGGHYTLDICHAGKTREAWNRGWKEEWIRIDDEFVSDLQPRDVFDISTESDDRVAYLLFYRQIVTSTRV